MSNQPWAPVKRTPCTWQNLLRSERGIARLSAHEYDGRMRVRNNVRQDKTQWHIFRNSFTCHVCIVQRRQCIQLPIEWGEKKRPTSVVVVTGFHLHRLYENVLGTSTFSFESRKEREAETTIRRGSEGKVESELIEKPMKGVFDIHSLATGHCTTNAYSAVLYIYTLIFSCVHRAAHASTKHTLSSKQGSTVETFDGAYYFVFFFSLLFCSLFRNSRFFVGSDYASASDHFLIYLRASFCWRLGPTDDASIVNWFFVLEEKKIHRKFKPIISISLNKNFWCVYFSRWSELIFLFP